MKGFLERWSKVSEVDSPESHKVEDEPLSVEPLHYAIVSSPILGEPTKESCLVGCGLSVKFYWQNKTGYGYCSSCDVHQRIAS
jgi:hypothetical protein